MKGVVVEWIAARTFKGRPPRWIQNLLNDTLREPDEDDYATTT